jgi:head-tail adaptor
MRSIDPGYVDINPADLRHQITFLEQSTAVDASGVGIVYAPGIPPDVAWAKMQAIKAADVIKGGSDVSQVRMTVTIRYRPRRVPSMRFQTANGSVYVIEAIENVLEMNALLVMTCLGIGASE